MRNVLIAGCGYIGAQVARKEQQIPSNVTALVRRASSVERLIKMGITVCISDLDEAKFSFSPDANAFDCVYYFIAPQQQGLTDKRSRNFIANHLLRIQTKRIVLISTTAVYGDCSGRWIDENEPVNPNFERGHRRLDAEKQWKKVSDRLNAPLTILRVAGIYGQGKLPLKRLERGDPVLSRTESPWSNRIYNKDLVDICFQAGNSNVEGTYNVTDGNPGTMTDYFLKVADMLGVKRPQEISLEEAKIQLGDGILSYLQESKRIRNDKILKALGIELKFPRLQQGLRDIAWTE